MTVPPRVNLVTLGVIDLDLETRFYEALGWRLSGSSVAGDVSFFDLSNVVLALWGRRSLAEDAHVPAGEPAEFRGVAAAINVASEAEVDAAIATAVDAGGSAAKLAHKADWGGYSGYFADPEGHLWEVAYNPYWPLDDNGLVQLPE